MRAKKIIVAAAAVFATVASLQGAASEKKVVVASVPPVYNIVKAIGGDRVELHLLVPPGASPHTFSPKPSAVKKLSKAAFYAGVGAGLEFWASKMIAASGNKNITVINMTDKIELIGVHEEAGHEGEAHGHEEGNPHVWLDPLIAEKFAARVASELKKISPADAAYFEANYKKFSAEIRALDKKLSAETKGFSQKDFISFHPSWVYFAARYGLNQAGEIQKTPGKEPTPKELQALVKEIKGMKIRAVFAEPQLPKKAAQVIAKEAGVKVLILDPLGGIGESYVEFIKRNFEVMKQAMK
jgi:zinc transport system substrate-binding protein